MASADQKRLFIQEQGFDAPPIDTCSSRYGVLQFQPRIVAGLFLVGLVLQKWFVFLIISALLGVGARWPEKNPFDWLYRKTLGKKPGAEVMPPAPAPRRFSQGMAAGVTLLIALCLFFRRPLWALMLEAVMAAALFALVAFGTCLGSKIYYKLYK